MVCLKLMVGLQSARSEKFLLVHIYVLQGEGVGERGRNEREREREREGEGYSEPLNKGQLRDASVLF